METSRAQHKHDVKESKKNSFRKFVEQLNKRTSKAKMYEIMRKIKGQSQRKINILCENEQFLSVPDVANRFLD